MEKISELMNMVDFRSALLGAEKEVRTYEKKSEHVYRPEAARFKLVVYFKNGYTRYFYSYDNKVHNKERFTDEYEGFLKLLRLLNKYAGEYKNAVIYATIDPNKAANGNSYEYQVLFRNMYGKQYENSAVTFVNDGKNITLNIKHLEVYGNKKINK